MKIRIKGNSIRFRLTKTEVAKLAETGFVEETTSFPSGETFRYAVVSSPEGTKGASFEDGSIIVSIPNDWAKAWNSNEEVGTSFSLNGPTTDLNVLIEKDFNCLVVRENEDESDHFKNPLSAHPAC